MLHFLRQVFNIVLTTTNGVQSFVTSVFNLSHALGFLIVKYILLCYTTLSDVIATAVNVLKVLYDDFCIFIVDLSGKINDICWLLFGSAFTTVSTVKNAASAVKDSTLYIFDSIINTFHFILNSIGKGFGLFVDLAELAKWSVILIGRGFWLAIQLIPLCILYLGYSIASFLTFLIVTTYEQINACSLFFISKISAVGHWTASYLFDFPLESVLGLVLGCLIIYGVNKFHDHILRAVEQSVRRSARLARTMLVCLWFIISQSRFQFPRRNAAGPPVVDSDSDSTQDDEPAVPVRRSLRLQTRRSDPKQPENPEVLKRQLQMEKEEKLCVVCQDQNKCVIVIPCRHLCLCVDCSNILQHTTHQCPICRQAFERGISVFM